MRHTTEAGFAGDLTPRAVLFFPLVRPMMRCIMAGMNHMDSCPRSSSSSSPWSSDHEDYTVAVRQGFFRPCLLVCSSTGAGCGGDSHDPSVHRVRHPHVVDIRVVAQR